MTDADQPGERLRVSDIQRLSAQVARGESTAFAELHGRFTPGLRRYFHQRGGVQGETIDELVQATWSELWRVVRAGHYRPDRSAISTFVYAIAHHVRLRHHARRPIRPPETPWPEDRDVPDEHLDPAGALALAELLQAVRACLDSPLLSDEERAVVGGVAHGSSERQLAARLGVSASTINAWKRTGYQKLRICLRRRGFDPAQIERVTGAGE